MLNSSAASRRFRVGIDVGGTFTDLQFLDEDARLLHEHKTSTVPSDPSVGVVTGVLEAAEKFGFSPDEITMIVHGTTIATNAVLEHKLPRCALVTTAGFEDILEIGRHSRKDIYSLYAEERRLLVPRDLRFGVSGRIDATGAEAEPLDEAQITALADRLKELGIGVVAICLMNAYANPDHERRVAELLLDRNKEIEVCKSTDIAPEIREYERTSTAVLNAALMPIVKRYMERLSGRLHESGVDATVLIVQSNGGVSSPIKAGDEPARLLLSGPCGGVIAAERLSEMLGEPNLIAVDMGGTSFDISVVEGGRMTKVTEGEVDGCPVRLPMAEIRTIGAGGGSIAWVDAAGRMRVGPQSAGAVPGPACYGRGGTQATVTDANLALGRIAPDAFMGGAMTLSLEASRDAVRQTIAEPLSLDPDEAAEGILAIADNHMASAIRISLFERGLDPEDFAMIAFGGAGGLHAVAVAAEVGVKRVVFPHNASTLSAYGMLWSDIVHDFARTKLCLAEPTVLPEVNAILSELCREAANALGQDKVSAQDVEIGAAMDLRYKGQGYELTVPVAGGSLDADGLAQAIEAFHEAHTQRFAHCYRGDPVEIVTLRASGRGRMPKPGIQPYAPAAEAQGRTTRQVFMLGQWRDVPILARRALAVGATHAGPVIIEEPYTNVVVLPGWTLKVMPNGELVATLMH